MHGPNRLRYERVKQPLFPSFVHLVILKALESSSAVSLSVCIVGKQPTVSALHSRNASSVPLSLESAYLYFSQLPKMFNIFSPFKVGIKNLFFSLRYKGLKTGVMGFHKR